MEEGSPSNTRQLSPPRKRRKYASRACDLCKSKKSRCEGTLPCPRCQHYGVTCTYDAPYSRGAAAPVVSTSRTAERERGRPIDSPLEGIESFLGASSNLDYSRAAQAELRSRASSPFTVVERDSPLVVNSAAQPQPSGRDAKRSTLNFTEPPFPPLNLARYSLLSTEHGLLLVSWYFENASPTYRFLHRQTMEKMVCTLCASAEWLGRPIFAIERIEMGKAEEALVLMVWAMACQLPMSPTVKPLTSTEKEWLRQRGEDYFQVASKLLEHEDSVIDRLSALQARLLMCQYLLTTSRLKLAWDLFASVKNMAVNLDLNKPLPSLVNIQRYTSRGRDSLNTNLHSELRLRAFWSIYTLDSYLATMLGKSHTFEERDIRVGYPSLRDDHDLETQGQREPTEPVAIIEDDQPSLMLGLIAHAKLARVIRQTLIRLYRDQDLEAQFQNADTLLAEIERWDDDLPEFLRKKPSGGLQVVYARQSTVIQLAKHHAIILICRPFISSSKNSFPSPTGQPTPHRSIHYYQNHCLNAALNVYEMVSPLVRKGSISSQFWFTSYILFCAATILLVYLGHHPASSRRENIIGAAEKCCEMERKLGSSSRLAKRYLVALEALFAQVRKRSTPAATGDENGLVPGAVEDSEQSFPTNTNRVGAVHLTNRRSAGSEQLMNESGTDLPFISDTLEDFAWQPSLEHLIAETTGNNFFPDLDSIVTGGTEFSWLR